MTVRVGHLALVLGCGLAAACASAGGVEHVAPRTVSPPESQPEDAEAAVRFVSPYTYEHFIRAELARAQGDLEAAAVGYRHALTGADEDPLVIARLALVLDALGQSDEARDLLAHGDELDPESEAVWMARGQIAARHGARTAALGAYERAERCAPMSLGPVAALADLLAEAPERALAVLQRFAARNPRWRPSRLHTELRAALVRSDLDQATSALRALSMVAAPSQAQIESVAGLALEQGRPLLAHLLLGAPSTRMLDRALWLRVELAAHDHAGAELVLSSSTPEEFGGLAPIADGYLAIGHTHRARELAQLALDQAPRPSTAVTLLRASGLDALAAEVAARAALTRQ